MQKIGRYEILEEIGRGSMGAVFKAHDPQIGRIVAIKIILTANLPREENDLYRSRFYREAQAAGQMSHPGIVMIHDIAEDENGQPFLVMEYVEGHTLHKLLRPDPHGKISHRFKIERTLDLCAQVAEAMAYAHQRGVVHRDIKPSNIMVTPEGRAKIADFGIARLSGAEATHTASITGTPAYMSPEQFRGGTIDSRSDIFSLGSMLYWMATGEKAFPGDNVTQVSFNVVYREPAPPRHLVPDLPNDVATVLSRCLAKRAENRYALAEELAADLRAIIEGKRIVATSAPAELTVEDTVGTMQDVTPIGNPLPEATTEKQARAVAAKSVAPSVLTLALVAVLAALTWYWQRSPATQPDSATSKTARPPETPANTTSPAASAAADGTPPSAVAQPPPPAASPAASSSTPGGSLAGGGANVAKAPGLPVNPAPDVAAPKNASLGTGALLAIDCRHNFKDASLQIQTAGRTLLDTRLEKNKAANFTLSIPLRPGKHAFSVRVVSEADRYIEQAAIVGEFAKDQTQTLEIRFGRRAGLFGRTLSVKWKK